MSLSGHSVPEVHNTLVDRPDGSVHQDSNKRRIANLRRRAVQPRFAPYLFILPFFLLFIPFGIGAVLLALGMAFADWPLGQVPHFAGLSKFATIFADPVFGIGMLNTARMLIAYIVVLLPLALFLAICLKQLATHSVNLVQIIVFAPVTMSMIAVSVIFFLLYDDNAGLLNGVLASVGLPGVPFLSSAAFAPWAIVAMRFWRVLGYYAIMLFAGLQSIPDDLYEAAAIDGAGWWTRLWYITLPMLRPVVLFVLVAASVSAWEVFAEPNVLTNGGPARSTYTAVMYIFEMSFGRFDLGRGAAASAILAAAIVVSTVVLRALLRSRDRD